MEETEEKPELGELRRLDYINYQQTSNEPRISDRTVLTDYVELDRELNHPYLKSPVLREIDDKISDFVKNKLTNGGIDVDQDLLERMNEYQRERLEVDKNLQIEGEGEKDDIEMKVFDEVKLEGEADNENIERTSENFEKFEENVKVNDASNDSSKSGSNESGDASDGGR